MFWLLDLSHACYLEVYFFSVLDCKPAIVRDMFYASFIQTVVDTVLERLYVLHKHVMIIKTATSDKTLVLHNK